MEAFAGVALGKHQPVALHPALGGNPADRRQVGGFQIREYRQFPQVGKFRAAFVHGRYFTSATQT